METQQLEVGICDRRGSLGLNVMQDIPTCNFNQHFNSGRGHYINEQMPDIQLYVEMDCGHIANVLPAASGSIKVQEERGVACQN